MKYVLMLCNVCVVSSIRLKKHTLNEFNEIIVNQKSVRNRRTHETKGAVLRVTQPEGDSSREEENIDQRNHFYQNMSIDKTD